MVMNYDFLNDAFKQLNILKEDTVDLSADGMEKLDAIINDEEVQDEEVDIIDPEATNEDELADSYIGQVIVECPVCHSFVFKHKEELVIDEDKVNVEEFCPYCGEAGGYNVIGEVAPFNGDAEEEKPEENAEDAVEEKPEEESEETEVADEEPKEEEEAEEEAPVTEELTEEKCCDSEDCDDDKCDEHCDLSGNCDLEEGIEAVELKTDDETSTNINIEGGEIKVTAEENKDEAEGEEKAEPEEVAETEEASEEEIVAPVEDQTVSEIEVNSDEAKLDAAGIDVEEEPAEEPKEEEAENTEKAEEETAEEPTEEDVDIDEIEEESFNKLGTNYLRRVYENVNSFKTTEANIVGNKLVLEGVISFKSGAQKHTSFVFEARDITRSNRVRFIGENSQICRGKRAFVLGGTLKDGTLITESLNYNYTAKNTEGNSTRVHGTVRAL